MFSTKSTLKKVLAAILAMTFILASVSLLTACGGKSDTTTDVGTFDSLTTTEEIIPPEVMDRTFNDYTFKVLIANRSGKTPNDFDASEPETAMGAAAYRRNEIMKTKYGIIVDFEMDIGAGGSKPLHKGYEKVELQTTTKTNNYDLAVINTYTAAPLTTANMLYDLNSIPHLDLSKAWWDKTVVDGITINDSIYFVSGDITTTVDDYMYCTIFNKKLYEKYAEDSVEDLYALVDEGKWTLDELGKRTTLIGDPDKAEGAETNDIINGGDVFGLMTWHDELYACIQADGSGIATLTEDGKIKMTLNTERNYKIMEKYLKIAAHETTLNFQNNAEGQEMFGYSWVKAFSGDRVMFFMTNLNELNNFRNMETDYGILPNPKYEADRDWYTTFVAGLAAFVCVPGYVEDIERTGIVTELLGYHALETIKPGYYTKTLTGLYCTDEESTNSLTIILDNKHVDIGHYFKIGGLNTALYQVSQSDTPSTFASKWEAAQDKVITDVTAINKQFSALGKTE